MTKFGCVLPVEETRVSPRATTGGSMVHKRFMVSYSSALAGMSARPMSATLLVGFCFGCTRGSIDTVGS